MIRASRYIFTIKNKQARDCTETVREYLLQYHGQEFPFYCKEEATKIKSSVIGKLGIMAEAKPNKQTQKKEKKKKDSGVEAITAVLKALPADQQVATLLSKYAELAEDNRHLQTSVKGVERQIQVLQKEKEQMESDHTKAVLTKSRLESLCRELQRQNKVIKDENLTRLKEEEERRKEVSTKFNTTLSEISNLMKENSDKNSKLRDENQDMAGRLQDLVKQYEAREQHVEKMLKQRDLQCQLLEAKIAKQQIENTEEKEKMLIEKKTLLEEVASYQQKTQQMSMTEISLRTQLNSYMEKYEEFQTMLDKSNKIFNTFKKEMDEMTKKIKKLEKETKTWKERWEGANKALLDMVTERSELEKRLDTQIRQNTQLQNLCRALQNQLTELRNKEKERNASKVSEKAKIEEIEDFAKEEDEGHNEDSCEPVVFKPTVEDSESSSCNAVAETSAVVLSADKSEAGKSDVHMKTSKEGEETLISDVVEALTQVENGEGVVPVATQKETMIAEFCIKTSEAKGGPLVSNSHEVPPQLENGTDVASTENECTIAEAHIHTSQEEEKKKEPLISHFDDVD